MKPARPTPPDHPGESDVAADARRVVERYFRAMQAGRTARDELFGLFHEDAVYVEPFTGTPRSHSGIAAIRDAFEESWKNPPPDLAVKVDRIDLDGDRVRSEWVCTSPAFPGPMRGYDVCRVERGRIVSLEVNLLGARA